MGKFGVNEVSNFHSDLFSHAIKGIVLVIYSCDET